MTTFKKLRLTAILLSIGCNHSDVQQKIDQWNAAFLARKGACERGDLPSCRTACEMSRKPSVCADVARTADPKNPNQKAWVEQCFQKALEDGRSVCEDALARNAIASETPKLPAEAVVPAPTPVSVAPIVQNIARFERIPARGMLPKVGTPTPVALEQEGLGPAFLAANDSGLVKLDEEGFSTIFREPDNLLQITQGPKRELWLLDNNAVYRLEEGRLDRFEGEGRSKNFDKITVDPKGDVWVLGMYGVSRFDGSTWSLYDKKSLTGAEYATLHSIEADSEGRVWISGHEAVYVYSGGRWQVLNVNQNTDRKMYLGPAAVADRKLYIEATGGLLQVSGEDWMQETGADSFSAHHLRFRNQTLYLASYAEVRILPLSDNEPIRKFKGAGVDFTSTSIRAFDADGRGRIWLSDDAGPTVIDKRGAAVHFPLGSVDAIRGRVSDILVVGLGPTLPKSVGPIRTSPVLGRITQNGHSADMVEVEICPSASSLMRKTPCEGQPFHGRAFTDAAGRFRFDNVPLAAMQLAYRKKGGEQWIVPLGTCCRDRVSGQPFKLGDIEMTKGTMVFMFR